mgnify:CR=1 FL=1
MNLVIVGAGKVGETLISNFISEKHDIFVIDISSSKISNIVNKYDVNGYTGSCLERDVLLSSGVDKADFVIACTMQDEKNILCCALAKKLGAKYTIARVRDPELFMEIDNMKAVFGLDFFFNPELQTAEEIFRVLKYPSAKSVETFANGKASMIEFTIGKDSPIVNKPIIEISRQEGSDFLFGIVKRDGKTYIPHGDFVIKENDTVYLITAEESLYRITKKLQIFKRGAKSVFILGGGKIAYYLSEKLVKENIGVKIVESNEQRAKELSKSLPKATVLLFDATNQELLDEEKLQDNDACVALTGMDEENVIISLYARSKGVNKVVTKVDSPSIISMVSQLNLDTIVSPKNIIANHIIRFVRSHQTKSTNINTLYKLTNLAEALEFTVDSEFAYTNIALKDLSIKNNVLIGGIVRQGEFLLPDGKTTFKKDDKVIILTIDSKITQLSQIIK